MGFALLKLGFQLLCPESGFGELLSEAEGLSF